MFLSRCLRIAKLAVGGLTILSCQSAAERSAWTQLEFEGFEKVEIEERAGRSGVFDFTATRGAYLCDGEVQVRQLPKGIVVSTDQHCRLDERGCDRGGAAICADLARMHDSGDSDPHDPVQQDRPRATRLFKLACMHGDANACRIMGHRLARGIGTQVDRQQAVAMLDRGCTRGSAGACFELGRRCEQGLDVARDPARADRLFARACWDGVLRACPWEKGKTARRPNRRQAE